MKEDLHCFIDGDAELGKPKACRQGWREIKCEECGLHCAIPTRDHASHSIEYCPACTNTCVIRSSWPDANLVVDQWGNLVE